MLKFTNSFADIIVSGFGFSIVGVVYKGPNKNGIIIPVQIQTSVSDPKVPLMHTGANSLQYLGQKKVSNPTPKP